MGKLTTTALTQLSSNETSAVNAINNNMTAIETAVENTLSRDGTSPNTMSANIDMNSNSLLNVNDISTTTISVGGTSLTAQVAASAASAAAALASEQAAAISETNAAGSASSASADAIATAADAVSTAADASATAADVITTAASESAAAASAAAAQVAKIEWQGVYNASTAYALNDAVSYLGSSFICIQAGTGQTPVVGGTAYWDDLALKGDTGASGAGTGDMIAANNLSDLVSVPTALTNLGLASVAYGPASAIDSSIALFDGVTGKIIKDSTYTITAAGAALLDDATASDQTTTLGLGTGDSPQFTAVNVGHATDTTITRVSAGVIAVEGATVATGTGVATTAASQAEMEAGTEAALRSVSPLRVAQAIAALAGGSGLVYISSATASSSASLDFDAPFDGTYDEYVVKLTGFQPATDRVGLVLRITDDSGATFEAAGYQYVVNWQNSGQSDTLTVSTSASEILLSAPSSSAGSLGNAAAEGADFEIKFHKPSATGINKRVNYSGTYTSTTGQISRSDGVGKFDTNTNAITGFRVFMTSGNIAVGTARLYGIVNS